MSDDVLDCPVCMLPYDDSSKRPRVLPCGHSFCTPCLLEIRQQGMVTCPTCRTRHTVPETGRFPVSFGLEAIVKRMRSMILKSGPYEPQKDPANMYLAGDGMQKSLLSQEVQSMLQDQEEKLVAAISACQEVKEQLGLYKTTLSAWGEEQQLLENRLQALVDQSKSARLLVGEEEFRVLKKHQEVDEREGWLQAALETLRESASEEQALYALEKADNLGREEESQRREEYLTMFPDMHTIAVMNRVKDMSKSALTSAAKELRAHHTLAGAAGDTRNLPTSSVSSITDRVNALISPLVKTEDLRHLTPPAKDLLQRGLVYAVHTMEEGERRNARISLEENNSVYLHCLREQPLPRDTITLPVEELVCSSPPCLVFLELALPGSEPRRVVIRLYPDTPRGRQFLMLCVGQRGPCYTGTPLIRVGMKGEPGECVVGGDYERSEGSGGAALVPHLDNGEYRGGTGRAGDVWGWWLGVPSRGAQFAITTKDRPNYMYSRPCVFGSVVSGLDVVAAAAQHHSITEVTVVDSGAILWQQ